MRNDAKFSVVIPVYNTPDDDLIYCLESVKNQTFCNYEVIIVDDGSKIETKNVLSRYSDLFKIIEHPTNMGIVAGRMTGIKHASGDYVFFLDSDDCLSKDCLETFNNIYKKYNPDVILNETPRFVHTIDEDIKPKRLLFPEGLIPKETVLKEVLSLHMNSIADKITKREFLDFTDKDVDLSIINGEDLQQSVYVVLKANTFYYLHKDVAYYRFNEEIREYYNVKRLHDINYMVPPYKMVFEKRNDYNHLLPVYKHGCVNNIIATGFLLLELNEPFTNKKGYLDELMSLDISKLLMSIDVKIPISSRIVFSLLAKRHYKAFSLVYHIFNLK